MKKLCISLLILILFFGLVACGKKPEVKPFNGEYIVKGMSYSGPINDTYVFAGETTDGVITSLTFDVIRDKGTDKELSKKNIMGYVMNVSDAKIAKEGDALTLSLGVNGYDTKFGNGNPALAQFMLSASTKNLTAETTFKDLVFFSIAQQTVIPAEQALIAYQYLATENGMETLTVDTLVSDLLVKHELFKDGQFVEGSKRISFAGFNGGRSYGEQLDAITAYILDHKMTLEQVYEMFKTENQQTTPIEDRDLISGATISFTGDFQRAVYVAMNGELFEGVSGHSTKDGNTVVQVLTQGYGGEMTTAVTFNAEGTIVDITVTNGFESENIGALLTAVNSDFIQALLAGQSDVNGVDVVSGASVTSTALKNAVVFAQEYYKTLK